MKAHKKLLKCEAKVIKAFKYKCLLGFTLFFAALYALWGLMEHWTLSPAYNATLIIGTLLFARLIARYRLKEFKPKPVFSKIEALYPELQERAYTALDLLKSKSYKTLNLFEKRVVDEVIEHEEKHLWISKQFKAPVSKFQTLYYLSICLLIYVVVAQKPQQKQEVIDEKPSVVAEVSNKVVVEPGHLEIERFRNAIITAKFETKLNSQVELIHKQSGESKTHTMQKNLDDNLYAIQLKRIEDHGSYQVRWQQENKGYQSETFKIEVFDYPKIENLEVVITPPKHYEKPPQILNNPQKVRAYKGSTITLKAKLNKGGVTAILEDQNEENPLTFKTVKDQPKQLELEFELQQKLVTEIKLSDEKFRSNQLPIKLSFEILKNKQPKIDVVLPKRDIELTAISELPLKAKIKDDVGLIDWGLELYINGMDPIIISHQNQSTNKSPTIDTYIPLELYDLRERDVLSYHFYAIDIDLEKKERKIFSDLYYVQIRPYLRKYVQGEPQPGEPGEGDILAPFLANQKEVIAALFKLKIMHHNDSTKEQLTKARDTISKSQKEIADALQEKIDTMSPDKAELKAKLGQIQVAMVEASKNQNALDVPAHDDQLQELLSQAQAILSELFKLRSSIMMMSQKTSSSSSNSSQQAQMRKKKKLKLAANSKYKEEQQSAQDQSALSQEMKTLHELQELAQRQLDLNREMESLLAQLEKAEDKEEVLRKLKKLREEQEQLQKEAQAMQDEMQNSENAQQQASNQQQNNQQKEQLQKSAQAMQQAAQNLQDEKFDEALANSQKAQRELEKAEEQMREASSQKLGELMSQLSQQAQQLEQNLEQEQQATKELQQQPKGLSNSEERKERSESIQQRQKELNDLLSAVESVTRSSDNTQKALSDELYRALRQAKVDQIDQNLEEASELTQHGIYSEAVNNLKEGEEKVSQLSQAIDKAASRILGDESEALAQAQELLQNFADSIEQELNALSDNAQMALAMNNPQNTEQQEQAQQQGQQQSQQQANSQSQQQGQGQQQSQQQANAQSQQQGQGQQQSQQQANSLSQQQGQGQQQSQQQANSQSQQQGQGQQQSQQQANSQSQQQGQGQQQSQQQANSQSQQQGQGQQQSQQQANSQSQQQGQGQQQSQQQANSLSQQQGQGQQQGRSQQPNSMAQQSTNPRTNPNSLEQSGHSNGIFNQPGEVRDWLLELRNVEQLMRDRDQRQTLSGIRDRLREFYHDQKRHSKAPQADKIRQQIYDPLVKLLKKMDATQLELLREKEQIQIDRDPIPDEFKKMVQEYFLNLSESE